ncbi:MAG: DNA alkylation repair protein [Lachnospiraceae bacterium]|nr:DNA alkylation repair protein [Lachnospiraceae bacterium]
MKDIFFTNELVKERIFDLAESAYQTFSSSLIPGCQNMLGCRIPALRSLAKEICKTDFRKYLDNASDDYFEETMLQGFVIGYAKMDIEERLCFAKKFIPKIKDWSVNDGFCSTFKAAAQNRERVWEFLLPYAQSGKEFEIRVAAVMYMDYFLTEEYIDRVLKMLFFMKQDDYYAMMGIAWALATAYAKFPKETEAALNWDWPRNTLNKAIQKMCESYRVSNEDKIELRKRKK